MKVTKTEVFVLQVNSEQLKFAAACAAAKTVPPSFHPLHTGERERGGGVLELCVTTQQTA